MKPLLLSYLVVILSSVSSSLLAIEPTADSEILAQRGKGVVTQTDFSARASKIPENIRRATLRDGKRFRDVLNNMLLRAQLTADAREAGFDKDQVIIDRMRLAAEAELGDAWLAHYVAVRPEADFEALAREKYQLNQAQFMSPPKIDVSHLLISNKERSTIEAKAIADSVAQQIKATPGSFDHLVLQYSEDPSASSNKGRFFGVKQGDMVKPFEEAAFALPEGGISDPVETQYGFHIIRLDAHIAPTMMEFDEVKEQLIVAEQQGHEERIKQDYLSGLTSIDVMMSEEALEEMVRRQFGENYADQQKENK